MLKGVDVGRLAAQVRSLAGMQSKCWLRSTSSVPPQGRVVLALAASRLRLGAASGPVVGGEGGLV